MDAAANYLRRIQCNKAIAIFHSRSGSIVSKVIRTAVARAVTVVATTLTALIGTAQADTTRVSDALAVKPDKCISLRRGLVCYQRVRFNWSLGEAGDYCLIEEAASSPMICWTQLRSGSYVTEFASSENKTYYLIDKSTSRKITEVTMQVAWVYRSKRRSRGRWRLF